MNYQEQLAKINATIKAKHAQIGEIMTKSVSNGHTPSDDDENTITELETDIARLEKSAERLQKLIKSVETATPSLTEVAGETPEQAAASAKGEPDPKKTTNVQVVKSLPKGIGFAQMAKAKALSARLAKQGSYVAPAQIAESTQGILRKPNRHQTWQQFAENWITSKLLRGNAYIFKQRDIFGDVWQLYVLNPDRVKVLVSDNGDVLDD